MKITEYIQRLFQAKSSNKRELECSGEINRLIRQNELIMNNIKSGLAYITPDFHVKWSNFSEAFKDTRAAKYYAEGRLCYESFHRSSPCENCLMLRAMLSHKSESKEYEIARGHQTIEIVANPILSNDNQLEGIIIKVDDITEKKAIIHNLKKAEQEASASNKLLHTILDNLPSYIFVKDIDDDYKYILANKKLCLEIGRQEADIVGKTDYEIFPIKEEADKYRKDDMETVESNSTKIINGEFVSMKEAVKVSYTVKTPLVDVDNDNKRLLVGIGLDITENHRAYQELEVAKRKAEESDRLKSAFIANMSHEIRTPLNAIVGFSELMRTCRDDAEKDEYMRIISTNNELLLRLINDILDLSKLESGIVEFKNSEFDLVPFFDEMAFTMKRHITNPDVEFIVVNPYQSCIINTDKTRMSQVLHNFMTNAIKYTTKGHIKMGYEHINDGIRIYVEDTGIGIPDEKRARVFDRFEKLDSFAQGTGLGLSICRAITELGGGNIGFESEYGSGSLFWSWKPLKADVLYK